MQQSVVQHHVFCHAAADTVEGVADLRALARPGLVALLIVEIQPQRRRTGVGPVLEQARQRGLFDGVGRGAGGEAVDIGLGRLGVVDQGREVLAGQPLAGGQVQLGLADALVDQEGVHFGVVLQVA